MKLRPTACWRMRTSPGPGAATSTLSYVRTSGPPTLCTRTALVIVRSPGYFPPIRTESHRGHVVNRGLRGAARELRRGGPDCDDQGKTAARSTRLSLPTKKYRKQPHAK